MTEENIYRAPQSSLVLDEAGDARVASRWARLGAAILDSLLLGIIIMPVAFAFGLVEAAMASAQAGQNVSLYYSIAMALLGIVGFLALNGYLLATRGQTLGKKLVGIRIVDMENRLLPFGRLIGLRFLPVWIVSNLPGIGGILPLVDVLLIFRSDKRCVHDLIAGTQVVTG